MRRLQNIGTCAFQYSLQIPSGVRLTLDQKQRVPARLECSKTVLGARHHANTEGNDRVRAERTPDSHISSTG